MYSLSIVLNVLLTVVCIYLYRQSCLDSSTQLLNKQQFNRDVVLKSKLRRSNDKVVIIDIDKFKQVNDTRGHEHGDKIISIVSKVIQSNLRSSDRAYRIGGDEFAIVCSCASIGHRIREELNTHNILVSVGSGTTYREADAAMYLDKRRTL